MAAARALYEPAPSDEALAALGFAAADFAAEEVRVWPENLKAVNLFIDLATQWRVGMAGATGLDYAAVAALMRLQGIRKKRRPEILESLQIMEAEALKVLREQSDG